MVKPGRLKSRPKREAAKHVDSFGVGFWIRVRFPAPPPKILERASSRQSEPPAVAGGHFVVRESPMWNDTDVPLAHLITFRCYGTWLHGDARGSVDRLHNQYKAPYAAANENRNRHNRGMLKCAPVALDASRRASVETAICETCDHRRWTLRAMNVRTNHV